MPDVTMCPGGACPLRQRCYRYRAVPDGRQDAFGAVPFDEEAGACELFWDVARLAPSDEAIRTRAYYLWLAAGRPHGAAETHWYAARAQLVAAAAALLRDELP
ncbi:MAG: DUF2934 domain-containing protein [Kofleriaceae bacterium]|nr:DUF2934 domain-containing protein [Kofleriaceae bacterium]